MTIKSFFHVLYTTYFVLFAVLAVIVILLVNNQRELTLSQKVRYESYLLANELHQSSDDLTRMARTYVTTGDPKFEQYYWHILAIRNGTTPRPEHYQRFSWNFVAAKDAAPGPGVRAVPLQTLMKELGFSDSEFTKLQVAQALSDALVRTEEIAMNAMKGLYDDGSGRFTKKGPPDREMAIRLMFDKAYHRNKAAISEPIEEFFTMLDERTAATTDQCVRRSNGYLYSILGMLIFLTGLMGVSRVVIARRISEPIEALQHQTQMVADDLARLTDVAKEITNGNLAQTFAAGAQPLQLVSHDEIGDLARKHDFMIACLQQTGRSVTTMAADLGERSIQLQHVNQKLERKNALLDDAIRAAEAATLAQQENIEELENLYRMAPVGLSLIDRDYRIVRINELLSALDGKSVQELVGRTVREINPQVALGVEAVVDQVFASGESILNVETHAVSLGDPTQKEQCLLLSYYPVKSSDGTTRCVGSVVLDITDRNNAAEALRRSEEEARLLMESMPNFVWVTQPDGFCIYINQKWIEFTGLSLKETLGNGWLEPFHPEDRLLALAAWKHATDTEGEYEIEFRLRRADGIFRWFVTRGLPLRDSSGRIVKWIGTCTDIDDQKRIAADLQEAKQTAEAASQAKSEFLANMSHEIRTPMNGILGMTELTLDTNLTTEQREYLEMVQLSGLNLLTVINDLLDFSKIEAGQLQLDLVEFEIARVVGGALRTVAIRAQQKRLELACQIAADVPESLVGDAGRLSQIIVNLVGNAIKFTEQGEVVVRVRHEERSGDDVRLHITVQDTGIGIPLDKHTMIFEAFAQADGSTTRKYGGTGLGLSISATLVALMGGRLWVESEPGQGSTFHFTARMRVGHGSVAKRIRIPSPRLDGMSVLVVDDNATNRQILEEVLSRWRMRPTTASSGGDALALLDQAVAARTPFALVLLDAHMPVVDGFAVAEHIKACPALSAAAVLMLTSNGRPGDVERCRKLGIAAHLLKPVAQGELLEAVVRALNLSLERASEAKATAKAISPETRRPLRILLAEDNLVNQRLAVGLLKKRGHEVVIAGDGKQALMALESEPFDLLFMDLQMPDMGGFEATARVREDEKNTGRHLPIIAMTAHAMKGDRERCLAGGMDGYVSKPIMAGELFRVIDETLGAGGHDPQIPEKGATQGALDEVTTLPANETTSEVFDHARSLKRVGGNEQLLGEMVVLFAAEYPKRIHDIREAIIQEDAAALERAAHTLLGSVSSFCAPTALRAAEDLEMMGRDGRLTGAYASYESLQVAMDLLNPLLARLIESRPTVPVSSPGMGEPNEGFDCRR